VAPERWKAHPVQSTILRILVLVVPMVAGVSTGLALSRVVPRPEGPAVAGWWILLFVSSALVTEVVGRILRRLLPLAVLLKLTLIFPDRAPSRFAMARRVGSIRNLEERVRHAREHGVEDDPSRAAETILTLVAALSAHDRRTRGHSERVRAFADLLAEAVHLPAPARDRLRWSALLHDIGKLEVPSRILNKPGKPDPYEWETLQRHPAEGARLAAPLLSWLGEWGLAIEHHHERFDGAGYPSRLAGADISMGGRILAVADSFETMTAARAYKKPMSVSAAREELARCAGSQFDPAMVRAFLNVALGRLWRTAGPLAWLAQIPLVGAGAQVAQTAAAAATKVAVGLAAFGASGAIPAARGDTPHRPAAAALVAEATQPAADQDRGVDGEDRGGLQEGASRGGRGGPPGESQDELTDDAGGAGPGSTGDGPGGSGGGSGGGDGSGGGGDGSGGSGGESGSGEGGSGGGGDGPDPVGNTVDHVTDTVSDTVDKTGDTVGDVVGDVRDTVGDSGSGGRGVGDVVEDVVGGLSDLLP
jgi:HD-GYP domain-containing protein (c-di-GMP phosphodiesterase class II)